MITPTAKENRSLYNSWNGMQHRCYDKKVRFYARYGGRGIVVSDSWKSYENFVSDMGPSWEKGRSIERIDNDGPYSKDNCRWASAEEQANNRSSSRFFSINGEIKTLAQWVKHLGLKGSTVRQRYYVYRWPIEQCLSGK